MPSVPELLEESLETYPPFVGEELPAPTTPTFPTNDAATGGNSPHDGERPFRRRNKISTPHISNMEYARAYQLSKARSDKTGGASPVLPAPQNRWQYSDDDAEFAIVPVAPRDAWWLLNESGLTSPSARPNTPQTPNADVDQRNAVDITRQAGERDLSVETGEKPAEASPAHRPGDPICRVSDSGSSEMMTESAKACLKGLCLRIPSDASRQTRQG